MPSLESIQKLLTKEPNDVFLNFGLAVELGRQGRVEDSAVQFDRVLSLDGNYCPAFFQKGRMYLAAGRLDDAKAALRAGIETARRIGEDHAAGEMSDLLDSI